MIEYFMGNDSLYTLTISKQKMFIESQLLPNQWRDSFDVFRKTFVEKPKDGTSGLQSLNDFTRLSHYFYNILLKNPVAQLETSEKSKEAIQRLQIIPDAWLGYMPFALLTERLETTWDADEASQPSYLFLKYALSCDYSHDFQYNTPYKISYFKPIQVGAYGISYEHENKTNLIASVTKSKSGKNYAPLPNAHQEIQGISQIFENQLDTFTDVSVHSNKTTKSVFLNQIKKQQYNILHLSMHADMNETNPLESALIFSKRDTLAGDNKLTTNEIYALDLNNNYLMVLSACNTAVGKWHRGEGIMSVSRAFSFAGCKSLFATLWSVAEGDAGKLTQLFYKNLKAGMDKDIALQKAQIQHFRHKAPYQWAFPIMTGDVQKIDIQLNTYWYYFLLIPILIGLGWLIRRFIN
jgi:CHAT domain-containing protein